MKQIVECVPNFSEGRDLAKIKEITDVIEGVEGVKLLNVDPGNATNRTVVTFVGEPELVIEAAYYAIKKASEIIDMSKHSGEHPRMGATDVCPLIPVSNISMEDTVEYARKLGKRVGDEVGIPIFAYEFAAFNEQRRNLAYCRTGEYEGLEKRFAQPEWKPDFGPAKFNKTAGATAIGARNFLIAYNINLNTRSVKRANSVAFDLRENGRVKRDQNGKIVKNASGETERESGRLKAVKGIGWYIEEYHMAQVSMNLTDISVTPLHIAFDEACQSATEHGLRVTGSELVGLVPLQSMVDTGKYFLKKQRRSVGVSEKELVRVAIQTLGLDELGEFDPEKRIIEYVMQDPECKLVDLKTTDLVDLTASEAPAPGGGSISALIGSFGTALGVMVANLSADKKEWKDRWEEYSDLAEKGCAIQKELLRLVDEDTNSFNQIMEAMRLSKKTEEDIKKRNSAIMEATKNAILIPLSVMEQALEGMKLVRVLAEKGNPNAISDVGVGALCLRSAAMGAHLNVKINMKDLADQKLCSEISNKASQIEEEVLELEVEVLTVVDSKVS